jgi:RNase P subunit RPR2
MVERSTIIDFLRVAQCNRNRLFRNNRRGIKTHYCATCQSFLNPRDRCPVVSEAARHAMANTP